MWTATSTLALPCPVVVHLFPQEAQACRSTRTLEGDPLNEGTLTVTNSDLHIAHFMVAAGVPAFTVGALIKLEAPPLVMTSARAAVALRRTTMASVMKVLIFCSFSFSRRFISPF